VILIGILIDGCPRGNKKTLHEDERSTVKKNNSISAKFEYITDDTVFRQTDAGGVEIKFNEWFISDGTENFVKDFVIGGRKFKSGLGIDGLTSEGSDTRDFAFVTYKVLKGKYSEVSGILGFDDHTRVKADSKMIVYANGKKIFESPKIDSQTPSVDVKFSIPQDTNNITFRFETNVIDNNIPKIVFADAKAKRAETNYTAH